MDRRFLYSEEDFDTRTKLIGGADVYKPVCRKHYITNQIVISASKEVLESYKGRAESCAETDAAMV